MAKQLVDYELWDVIKSLLPPPPKRTSARGRPRLSDRAALTGILFVLRSGIPWEMLPRELGLGSGMTCWRRLRDWHRAGVWQRLQHELLNRLRDAGALDWSRASVDASSVPAKKGRQDGAEPDRPREGWLEAPLGGRASRD